VAAFIGHLRRQVAQYEIPQSTTNWPWRKPRRRRQPRKERVSGQHEPRNCTPFQVLGMLNLLDDTQLSGQRDYRRRDSAQHLLAAQRHPDVTMESGRWILAPEPVRLRWRRGWKASWRAAAREEDVTLQVDIEDDLPEWVMADPSHACGRFCSTCSATR
jgi:hypothetical protein